MRHRRAPPRRTRNDYYFTLVISRPQNIFYLVTLCALTARERNNCTDGLNQYSTCLFCASLFQTIAPVQRPAGPISQYQLVPAVFRFPSRSAQISQHVLCFVASSLYTRTSPGMYSLSQRAPRQVAAALAGCRGRQQRSNVKPRRRAQRAGPASRACAAHKFHLTDKLLASVATSSALLYDASLSSRAPEPRAAIRFVACRVTRVLRMHLRSHSRRSNCPFALDCFVNFLFSPLSALSIDFS